MNYLMMKIINIFPLISNELGKVDQILPINHNCIEEHQDQEIEVSIKFSDIKV